MHDVAHGLFQLEARQIPGPAALVQALHLQHVHQLGYQRMTAQGQAPWVQPGTGLVQGLHQRAQGGPHHAFGHHVRRQVAVHHLAQQQQHGLPTTLAAAQGIQEGHGEGLDDPFQGGRAAAQQGFEGTHPVAGEFREPFVVDRLVDLALAAEVIGDRAHVATGPRGDVAHRGAGVAAGGKAGGRGLEQAVAGVVTIAHVALRGRVRSADWQRTLDVVEAL